MVGTIPGQGLDPGLLIPFLSLTVTDWAAICIQERPGQTDPVKQAIAHDADNLVRLLHLVDLIAGPKLVLADNVEPFQHLLG